MKYIVLCGRILFSFIFISSGSFHFSSDAIYLATMHKVPMADILVPISGLIAICGGLSVAFGYKTKIGAWMLILFLVPVTIFMHNFWAQPAASIPLQMAAFMKNVAMIGTALYISYFGAGSLSLDGFFKKRSLKSREVAVA